MYVYIHIYIYIYIHKLTRTIPPSCSAGIIIIIQEGIRKRTDLTEPNRIEPFFSEPARTVHFQEANRTDLIKHELETEPND